MSGDAVRLFRRKASILNGLTVLGAGMIAVTPTIVNDSRFSILAWVNDRVLVGGEIGWHVRLQVRYRQTR